MTDFIKRLRSIYGIVGGIATLVPGITYFQDLTPPDFGGFWVLTTGFAFFFLYVGYMLKVRMERVVRRAIIFIVLSMLSVAVYVPGFRSATVLNCVEVTNHDGEREPDCERIQVGPGLWSEGLTKKGREIVEADDEVRSPYILLGQMGISDDNVPVLWKQPWVVACSMLLVLMYNASVVCWVLAWGTFMKLKDVGVE